MVADVLEQVESSMAWEAARLVPMRSVRVEGAALGARVAVLAEKHIVPGEWNVVLRSGWIALRLRKHELEFDRPPICLFNLLDNAHHILFRA